MRKQKVLSKYFSYSQQKDIKSFLHYFYVQGFVFKFRKGKLRIHRIPKNDYLQNLKHSMNEELFLWEVIAYIKVRILKSPEEVIKDAITGDIYDEDYFQRRGGGGPYIDYSNDEKLHNHFRTLAKEIVKEFDNPDLKVLDSGCATGILVQKLQENNVNAHGFDISSWAIANGVTSNLYQSDARNLQFPETNFDMIISQDFMEHIPTSDLDLVFNNLDSKLKRGGAMFHFIPFGHDDHPHAIDVHLTNANKLWWIDFFSKKINYEIVYAPEKLDQWDYSDGILSSYFKIIKKNEKE